MGQKVSAKELMNIVTDTNEKVTAMASGQCIKAEGEQNYSALGMALAVAAIFQQAVC